MYHVHKKDWFFLNWYSWNTTTQFCLAYNFNLFTTSCPSENLLIGVSGNPKTLCLILKRSTCHHFHYIATNLYLFKSFTRHYYNKLIFLYLKTRHCKCYALNTMYITLYKLSWIRNLQNTQKFDPHKINKHTLQYKLLLTTQ